MGAEYEELYRGLELQRPQDEAIVFELGEAELECIADAHGKDGRMRRLISDRRVVVAVDNGDGFGRQQWLHAGGLGARDADGDEADPSAP